MSADSPPPSPDLAQIKLASQRLEVLRDFYEEVFGGVSHEACIHLRHAAVATIRSLLGGMSAIGPAELAEVDDRILGDGFSVRSEHGAGNVQWHLDKQCAADPDDQHTATRSGVGRWVTQMAMRITPGTGFTIVADEADGYVVRHAASAQAAPPPPEPAATMTVVRRGGESTIVSAIGGAGRWRWAGMQRSGVQRTGRVQHFYAFDLAEDVNGEGAFVTATNVGYADGTTSSDVLIDVAVVARRASLIVTNGADSDSEDFDYAIRIDIYTQRTALSLNAAPTELWRASQMPLYYVLGGEDGRTPVPCTHEEHSEWFRDPTRFGRNVVALTVDPVDPERRVSTVFLGRDERTDGYGPPLVFETMSIRRLARSRMGDRYQRRTSTWAAAVAAHKAIVAEVSDDGPRDWGDVEDHDDTADQDDP